MTRFSEKEIAKRELRRIAIHEAGHAAICFRFGGIGSPSVWRNTAEAVQSGEKAWRGHFKLFHPPGDTTNMNEETKAVLGLLPVTENWPVLFGLAGVVAEQIDDGVTDSDEIICEIECAIESDEVSQSDLNSMGKNWSAHVAEVVQLLLQKWEEIEVNAKCLSYVGDVEN